MDIHERLQMVMKMHNLNASQFADKIGVQRSSISHILTGRNKPSLDFVQKTLQYFPRVNAEWFVTGKSESNTLKREEKDLSDVAYSFDSEGLVVESDSGKNEKELPLNSLAKEVEEVAVEKIVWFYSDGSYKVYQQR
jgi:transcriptional regulator with XRE-family HTH domain